MARVLILPAHYCDILQVAENMREADRLEIAASGGWKPLEGLQASYEASSRCWTFFVGDTPAAIFGVVPYSVLTGIGIPWLLGTDDIGRVKRKFVKASEIYVDQMLSLYPTLCNFVDVRNELSVRWLKWLGFEMSEAVPIGKGGEWFYPFEKRLKENV